MLILTAAYTSPFQNKTSCVKYDPAAVDLQLYFKNLISATRQKVTKFNLILIKIYSNVLLVN